MALSSSSLAVWQSDAEVFPEVSIVMPCRNEEKSIGACVKEALSALKSSGLAGEVVIADNASTDRSATITRSLGARVVAVPELGYGNALIEGIVNSRGQFVIMGDADGSYPFCDIGKFVDLLKGGCDLVMGNRFAGEIEPGAMPWLNRYFGNPILSSIGRALFLTSVRDFNCGLRAFSRSAFDQMRLSAKGMEFASEMVIQAANRRLRVGEVPIVLRKDGRGGAGSHLRPWRDGWRNLKLMLVMRLQQTFRRFPKTSGFN